MQVIDFTNLPKRNKMYAGANGSKISVIYENEQYMLKFPPMPTKNKDSSLQNEECNFALKRIVPRIDIEKILGIVDEAPFISELQKEFYKTMIMKRKECILDFALAKLKNHEVFTH